MASIGRKTGKPNWQIRYKDAGGLQRYKSTGTEDRGEAERQLTEFIEKQQLAKLMAKHGFQPIANGGAGHNGKPDKFSEHRNRPIVEHIDDWSRYRQGRVTKKQMEETRQRLLRLVDEAKIKTLIDLTESRVERFCLNLRKRTSAKNYDPKKAAPASLPTRNSYRATARMFDKWLFRKGRQPELKLLGLEDEHDKTRVPTRERPPLEFADVEKLWQATRDSTQIVQGYDGFMRFMLYLTAATTGLRVREISSLTSESFQLGGEYPKVVVAAAWTKNGQEAKQPLPNYLVPLFHMFLAGKAEGKPIFPGLINKKTAKMMKHDLAAAGIAYKVGDNQYRDFHMWRHLYNTAAWTSGESPNVIRDLARHSDIKTTMGYSHSTDVQRHKAVNQMTRLPIPG